MSPDHRRRCQDCHAPKAARTRDHASIPGLLPCTVVPIQAQGVYEVSTSALVRPIIPQVTGTKFLGCASETIEEPKMTHVSACHGCIKTLIWDSGLLFFISFYFHGPFLKRVPVAICLWSPLDFKSPLASLQGSVHCQRLTACIWVLVLRIVSHPRAHSENVIYFSNQPAEMLPGYGFVGVNLRFLGDVSPTDLEPS